MAGILMIPDVNQILSIPPIIANGKFNMMIPDNGILWNSLNNNKKINNMEITEVRNNVRMQLVRFRIVHRIPRGNLPAG